MGNLPRYISTMLFNFYSVKAKFAGELWRLEPNPRKFSTENDLHYTVMAGTIVTRAIRM